MDAWTQEQIEQMDLNDTGIDENQLTWMLHRVTKWVSGDGETFRTFVEELGSDYSTVYNAGGMEFTNAVFDLINKEKPF